MIRPQPHYRRHAFEAGLQAAGFTIHDAVHPEPGDVLVIWNRYGRYEAEAARFEQAGATVLVVENGYIGKDDDGRQYYAISRNYHNGAGTWNVFPAKREIKGIEVKPWRKRGEEIVILAQRGIGCKGVAQPHHWVKDTFNRLLRDTSRTVRIRTHPGTRDCVPLEEDLDRAWCAVTWASGAAIKALCHGVPVFHGLKQWIGAPAARNNLDIEDPKRWGRGEMLHRLAWAQWTVDEITSGWPFRVLCES